MPPLRRNVQGGRSERLMDGRGFKACAVGAVRVFPPGRRRLLRVGGRAGRKRPRAARCARAIAFDDGQDRVEIALEIGSAVVERDAGESSEACGGLIALRSSEDAISVARKAERAMTDDPFTTPGHVSPPRVPRPGEFLFQFLRGQDRFLCELRYHGEWALKRSCSRTKSCSIRVDSTRGRRRCHGLRKNGKR